MSDLLTTKQAAEKKKVSVRRIQTLIKKGQLKAEKIGRDWFVSENDLQSIKTGKAGRPSKLPKDLEDGIWQFAGKSVSRRTMRNTYFYNRGLSILIKDGIKRYKFLYDESRELKGLGNNFTKKTVISELGRVRDKELLLLCAKRICKEKPSTVDAVAFIRNGRKKYGSFDEIYKPMPNGKFEIISTDNE